MIKLINIVGVRPQFIKYFPISQAINDFNSLSGNVLKDVLVHTGQHYDYEMSSVFFNEFGIKEPDYHLEVGSGSHGEQTGRIIERVEKIFTKETPDIVLLYGDTNSTLGGAIAASKLHIPIAHVEAGLRSFNKHMPEEINRILVDHVSTFLLCPANTAVNNLSSEGFTNIALDCDTGSVNKNNPIVINVGDVMYDVLLYALEVAERKSEILNKLQLEDSEYCLLTLHRAENTDKPANLAKVIDFVNKISESKTVIFPMHPRTKQVYEKSDKKFSPNIKITAPFGYFDILMLMKNSHLIMTDSGGMQKEAYWLRTPCITLREETEWVETVESGWNVLYKDYDGRHKPINNDGKHYGDGNTAAKIINILANAFIGL